MNKRTIIRRPLKVFCDRCSTCIHFCLISLWQDLDQQILSLLPRNVGQDPWLGQVLSSLLCGPNSNLVSAPSLETNKEILPSPSVTSLLALGMLPKLSDITGSHDPWLAAQVKAIPSSLWHHQPLQLESCPSLSPGSYSVLISCSAGLPKVTLLSYDLPNACSKEHMGSMGIYVRKIRSSKW